MHDVACAVIHCCAEAGDVDIISVRMTKS